MMKRKAISQDESIWSALQSRAQAERTTISALVRKAVQTNPSPSRAEAMQALVGIRTNDGNAEDSTAIIRRFRRGTRLSRLTN
jgi:hypothetical protein